MSQVGDVGDKPVTEQAEFVGGGKDLAIEGNGGGAGRDRRIPLDGGSLVDQFGLGNREVDFPGMSNCADGAKGSLEETRVGAVRGRRSSKGKIINI